MTFIVTSADIYVELKLILLLIATPTVLWRYSVSDLYDCNIYQIKHPTTYPKSRKLIYSCMLKISRRKLHRFTCFQNKNWKETPYKDFTDIIGKVFQENQVSMYYCNQHACMSIITVGVLQFLLFENLSRYLFIGAAFAIYYSH